MDQAGIDCKSLATHQPFFHTARNGRLKYAAQKATLPEPTVAVLGKRRMIRDAVTKVQAAEPAIGQVQMNLFAQAAFRPDAGAIAHKQHPDHQFGINGRATSVAVKLGKMRTNTTQVNEPINRTQQVVLGNVIFQRKLIKQCCLRLLPWPQHRKSPCAIHRLNQLSVLRSRNSFSTQSAERVHSLHLHGSSPRSAKATVHRSEHHARIAAVCIHGCQCAESGLHKVWLFSDSGPPRTTLRWQLRGRDIPTKGKF